MAQNGNLILTNYRLIEEKTSTGERKCKEIPLNKIDSIVTQSSSNLGAIAFGAIILLISVFILVEEEEVGAIGFVIGLIILIVGFFSQNEYVRFNSATISIRQEKKGMEKFTECVRRQIYGEFSR
ncbi:MAG: hypothetical protein HXS53_03275 [Theionarchaea archaeon]|nr:hypothetical protein [Theionarchaea archaeon]